MKQHKRDRIFILYHSINSHAVCAISNRIEQELGEACCTSAALDFSEPTSLAEYTQACDVFIYVYSYINSQLENKFSETVRNVFSEAEELNKRIILITLDDPIVPKYLSNLYYQQITDINNRSTMQVLYSTLKSRLADITIQKRNALPREEFKVGNLYYCARADRLSVEITDNDIEVPTDLVIEDTIKYAGFKYDIVGIGSWAFADNPNIKSIVLPDSITEIGTDPFSGCSSIANISVNAGNPVYDSREDCNALIETATNTLLLGSNNTIIPNSITVIDDYAFNNCVLLESIAIPANVVKIKSRFEGCTSLSRISVDAENPVYDSRENCNAIIETETNTLIVACNNSIVPNTIKEISPWAFTSLNNATSLNVPKGLKYIDSNIFKDLTHLESINIPDTVEWIAHDAFSGCSAISQISVDPNNPYYDSRDKCNAVIITRNDSLIIGCNTTNIPDTVRHIGIMAFGASTMLTRINIPKSVRKLGLNPFYNCTSLDSLSVEKGNPTYDSRGGCNAIIESKTNSLCIACNTTVIPGNVKKIKTYAFYKCQKLKSVVIPDGVTKIANDTFCKCSELTNVNIPESIMSIGKYAFAWCKSLTNITIPSTVRYLKEGAFYGCESLKSISFLGDNFEKIGVSIFTGATNLEAIYIPKGAKHKFQRFIKEGFEKLIFEID